MPSQTEETSDGERGSDAPDDDAAASRRTAFDALNPYGDFGGTDPSGGRLLLVVIICLVALAGVFGVGGLWAWDVSVAREREQAKAVAAESEAVHDARAPEKGGAESSAPHLEDSPGVEVEGKAEPEPGDSPEPASDEGAAPMPASDDAAEPKAGATDTTAKDDRPSSKAAMKRPAPPPPPPTRALVLIASRDRSDAEAKGLADALEAGFLERVRAISPDVSVGRGRPGLLDVGVKLVLTRFREGSGGGAHDVTARCAAVAKATDGTTSQNLDAQGRSQGVEASAALRAEAVRRCGAGLADALAPVIRSLN